MFRLVNWMVIFIIGCGDGEQPHRGAKAPARGNSSQPPADGIPVEELEENFDGEQAEAGAVPIGDGEEGLAALAELEPCFAFQDDDLSGFLTVRGDDSCAGSVCEQFAVYREQPYLVMVHGAPGVETCIAIHRSSGYLTISHQTGTVTHKDDFFEWCAVFGPSATERFLLRSLTPSSVVSLAVE